jgi:C1A family cysteine protease
MSSNPEPAEYDYGYDPTVDEPIEITPPTAALALPSSAMVNSKYLPPVGQQHTPNCCAWASTYGLATFTAAKAGNYTPNTSDLQASSAYIYIGVMKQDGIAQDVCRGSQFSSYFEILAQGGTPTMAQAPYEPNCTTLWQDYGSQSLDPDAAFTIKTVAAVNAKVPEQVKQIIASGFALAYGTSLYTDFPHYDGTPKPYVGSKVILKNPKTGKPAGHCMLIIGYDDTVGSGAFYIQNSFGTGWGSNGYIWMAYETFTTLAQGKAFYTKD